MAQTSETRVTESATAQLDTEAGKPLRVESVRKTFANETIVAADDINIEIQPNEFVVLLGPSGCGKTTTLRCISGLEIPDSGSIYIGDEDITDYKPKDRDLAFVFQSIALFPHMSVRENIRFGLDMTTDLSGEKKEQRVRQVAKALEIDDYLDRKPSELSGGQQQRVSIGRAMVMEPAAFLLDEPFSNLDANLRDQMQTEIKKLQRQLNRAMIFVTHDQAEAMTLADKIVIMRDGHILQQGSPHEIYNDPANLFVASFIGSPSTNLIECQVDDRGDRASLVREEFTLSLTEEQSQALRAHASQTVTMGIRPEYLELGASGLFEADITLIEPEGARDTVHLSAAGFEIHASTPQGQAESGSSPYIDFNVERIWVFDDKGDRLL